MDLLLTHGGALLPDPKIRGSGRATTLGIGSFNAPGCVLCRRISHRSPLFAAPLPSPWPPVRSISVVSSSARWVVDMEEPPAEVGSSRAEVVDYYVGVLARILGDENEAQSCIYDASWQNLYRFRCEIDDEARSVLAGFSNVLSIRPDKDVEPDQFTPKIPSLGSDSEHWLVRMKKPGVEVVTKAQIADYYTEILMKVLGNEKDAQVSIYHISWERDFGFCCQIDEECARGLADLPEVVSVLRDENIDSKIKVYGGGDLLKSLDSSKMAANAEIPAIKTKRLFVAGLSFYTSEKTLREAFEGFGDLVEVKIIIDKISKRSKGYAFIEYATEEAASMAMKEMNGKIINGWMIVVDVAKSGSSKKSDRPRWGPP